MRFFTDLPGDILQCLTFVAAHPIPVVAGALALATVVGVVAHAIRKGI
jgi:hypothetical protein